MLWIPAGKHTSLSKLGYDVDINRIERCLIETCEEVLGRTPMEPVEWSPEMVV